MNTVASSDLGLRNGSFCKKDPDLMDLCKRELAGRVLFSPQYREASLSKNASPVLAIFLVSHVLKILQAIVRLVAVLVVRLEAMGPWANKGVHHKPVNQEGLSIRGSAAQADCEVTLRSVLTDEHLAVAIPHTTEVRNLVPPFVTNNWKPEFFGHGVSRFASRGSGVTAAPARENRLSGATLAATRSLT